MTLCLIAAQFCLLFVLPQIHRETENTELHEGRLAFLSSSREGRNPFLSQRSSSSALSHFGLLLWLCESLSPRLSAPQSGLKFALGKTQKRARGRIHWVLCCCWRIRWLGDCLGPIWFSTLLYCGVQPKGQWYSCQLFGYWLRKQRELRTDRIFYIDLRVAAFCTEGGPKVCLWLRG